MIYWGQSLDNLGKLKIPLLIDYYRWVILRGLLGDFEKKHRDTYEPTSTTGWDCDIFHCSNASNIQETLYK